MRRARGAFALLSAAAALAASADGGAPTAQEMARLRTGETLVELSEEGGGAGRGTARRLLDADPARLLRAAADWAHYDEFFPFVRESSANEEPDGRVVARQVIDLPWPYADRRFAATAEWSRESAGTFRSRVAWAFIPGSGNVADNRGEWRFDEIEPGRTLVELHLTSDVGGGVPATFQRRALAATLPYAIDGLRQQANRCRYDLPRHPTCPEAPPVPDVDAAATKAR